MLFDLRPLRRPHPDHDVRHAGVHESRGDEVLACLAGVGHVVGRRHPLHDALRGSFALLGRVGVQDAAEDHQGHLQVSGSLHSEGMDSMI